jgi:hypothetical protein
MGKPSALSSSNGAQKSKAVKTPEERKRLHDLTIKSKSEVVCTVCKAGFLGNASAKALRDHALARHPKSTPGECFPVLKAEEDEGARVVAEAAAVKAEQKAERLRLEAEARAEERSTAIAKAERAAMYAKVAAAQTIFKPSRYKTASAEELQAAFTAACASLEGLEEGAADEDLIAAVAEAMADALEAHQEDGCADGSEVHEVFGDTVLAFLSAFLTEGQAEEALATVLAPLKLGWD